MIEELAWFLIVLGATYVIGQAIFNFLDEFNKWNDRRKEKKAL